MLLFAILSDLIYRSTPNLFVFTTIRPCILGCRPRARDSSGLVAFNSHFIKQRNVPQTSTYCGYFLLTSVSGEIFGNIRDKSVSRFLTTYWDSASRRASSQNWTIWRRWWSPETLWAQRAARTPVPGPGRFRCCPGPGGSCLGPPGTRKPHCAASSWTVLRVNSQWPNEES